MSDATGDAQIQQLQEQVAQLQSELDSKPRGHWIRTFWSTVLIVVAVILAPLSVVSVWARGEVTDTQRYVATMAPLAENPAIQDAVATRITDEIFTYIDVSALANEAISTLTSNRDLNARQTAALEALAGPLTQGVESYTADAVNKVVRSEQFAAAWNEANTRVHERLNAALTGDNTDNAVMIENNQVVLDLGNLITQVKQILISRGFTVAERIPTTDATIVLFDVPNAATVQTAYNLLNTVGFWLPIIAMVLALVGVFVCHTPRKALTWLGFGLMLSMALAVLLLAVGRTAYLAELPDTVNSQAAMALFDQLTGFLRQSLWAGAAAGLVLFLAGLLLGPNALSTAIRSLPVAAAAAIQRGLDGVGLHMEGARGWVAAQATGLRIAVSLAGLVFVMLQRYKTPELILWTTVGVLAVLFVIQILASGTEEEEIVVVEEVRA
ncbi:MAG: hypothetical protein H6526_04050 [Actinobacteria bacterium]|nr:hypothetical protein [Actinomycetota bacterium]MCB8997968.1 hypothetical protein [Actinomycetota bacterium]MCB9414435.1 hypothetical protein [Actinomycetota bacterium]MCB9424720.1 hypothetical protein [Actinomycetota bacterium]HRY08695.1 hypothetical protein [Candidatus Nanopelagicales bacterium]